MNHLWFFSQRTLVQLLQLSGFTLIELADDYSWPVPAGWRAPFSIATRLFGQLKGGGDILRIHGWKRP